MGAGVGAGAMARRGGERRGGLRLGLEEFPSTLRTVGKFSASSSLEAGPGIAHSGGAARKWEEVWGEEAKLGARQLVPGPPLHPAFLEQLGVAGGSWGTELSPQGGPGPQRSRPLPV